MARHRTPRACATTTATNIRSTPSEFGLLKVFAANPKRVLSRERLLELANARDAEAFDRAIDLQHHAHPPQDRARPDQARTVIRTIRGGGYLVLARTGRRKVGPESSFSGIWRRCCFAPLTSLAF